MKILKLLWISESAKEAELIISDGIHQCLAFSQPCHAQKEQIIHEPLHAFDVENLMKVVDHNQHESIHKTKESYFSHYCIAKVKNLNESIVSIGNLLIKIDGILPGWVDEGDLIEFKCARLDIW